MKEALKAVANGLGIVDLEGEYGRKRYQHRVSHLNFSWLDRVRESC